MSILLKDLSAPDGWITLHLSSSNGFYMQEIEQNQKVWLINVLKANKKNANIYFCFRKQFKQLSLAAAEHVIYIYTWYVP